MEEKNKPLIRFKGFEEALQSMQLGNICIIGDIDHRMPPTVANGIPYLMTGDFIGLNELDFENAKQISIEEYNQLSKKIKPEFGDILFARYASIGAVRYVETNKRFLISYSCAIIKKSDFIFEKYLFYYFHNKELQHQVELEINTGSQRNIGIDSLKKLHLQLPPKNEQKKIVNFFENLDKLITEHQQKHNKLKALKKAMLDKVFPKQRQTVPEIRFEGFKGDWNEHKLGSIGNPYTGLSGKTKNDFGHGEGRYITYMNVFSNPISDINMIDKIEIDLAQNEVIPGDVLFTVSSETAEEVGMSSVWTGSVKNIYLNSFCFGYRPKKKIDNYFLANLLRTQTFRKKMIFLAQGISRYNISKTKVMELNIMLPSYDEQLAIGRYFKNIDHLISNHEIQVTKLQNIKKAFLAKMFIK